MARVDVEGLNGLIDDFEKIIRLPEAVIMEMLHAEADVVVKAQKQEIEALGLKDTGQMKDSIARNVKRRSDSGVGKYLDIYPQGTRDDGVRNADVGFIHEFGAPRKKIPASGWMESANEKCAEEAVSAAEAVYHDFLDKNGM